MVFQYFTEPLCWFVGCAYLPYTIFRRAATDDGDHAALLVALAFYAAFTTVQNLPVIDKIIVWFPFFYELKLLLLALLTFAGGSQFCYGRFVAPVFRRFAKTPEELAAQLPSRLRTSFDGAENLQTFAAKVVETTPTMLAEHGVGAYRVVMAMLIQSSKELELNHGSMAAVVGEGGVHAVAGFFQGLSARIRGSAVGQRDRMVAGAIKTSLEAGMGGTSI
jgi:hypothetical protein